jgi:hypothetical protein
MLRVLSFLTAVAVVIVFVCVARPAQAGCCLDYISSHTSGGGYVNMPCGTGTCRFSLSAGCEYKQYHYVPCGLGLAGNVPWVQFDQSTCMAQTTIVCPCFCQFETHQGVNWQVCYGPIDC